MVSAPMHGMTAALRAKIPDPLALARLADWLAADVAVSLPWSTSATSVLIALWLAAVLPTLSIDRVRRELATAAGGLPVLLWALAAVGLVWADAAWSERLADFARYQRLLAIPLLLAQFRRSEHGFWVFYGYLASALSVLAASFALALVPGLSWRGVEFGVPAKDYIFQGESLALCALALIGVACERGRGGQWRAALGLIAVAALFLADIFLSPPAARFFSSAAAGGLRRLAAIRLEGFVGGGPRRLPRRHRGLVRLTLFADATERFGRRIRGLSRDRRQQLDRDASRVLAQIPADRGDGAGDRPWHRLDVGTVPPRDLGIHWGFLGRHRQPAQSDSRRRHPARPRRRWSARGDVDRTFAAVPRGKSRRAGRRDYGH